MKQSNGEDIGHGVSETGTKIKCTQGEIPSSIDEVKET
jgi:hypothetical protein